jgi:molybdopterin synthase catalytic subunit
MSVRIQEADFDLGVEITALRTGRKDIGAIASFIGLVRDFNEGDTVTGMHLEHYPAMTEKVLQEIIAQAMSRWKITDTLIIHRVGTLLPGDQIVLVVTASAHRGEAFAACEFLMDFLKIQAPFWKKEQTSEGNRWVNARQSDQMATEKWGSP